MKPQVEQLTMWWPDCSHDISCCYFLEVDSKKWQQTESELVLKINHPSNSQDDADRTTDDQFQDDCQADSLSLHGSLCV